MARGAGFHRSRFRLVARAGLPQTRISTCGRGRVLPQVKIPTCGRGGAATNQDFDPWQGGGLPQVEILTKATESRSPAGDPDIWVARPIHNLRTPRDSGVLQALNGNDGREKGWAQIRLCAWRD